jgi:hypothetical protein
MRFQQINVSLLKPLLQTLHQQQQRAAAEGNRPGTCGAIAPAMRELYAMVARDVPYVRVDEKQVEDEVAEIMAAVEGDCVRFPAAGTAAPLPSFLSGARAVAACSAADARPAASAAGGDASVADAAPGDYASDADCAVSEAGKVAAALETERQQEQEEAELGARLAEQYAQDEGGYDMDDGGWDAGGDDGISDEEGGETRDAPAAGEGDEASAAEGTAFSSLLGGEVRAFL